jgi:membrane protein
VSNIAAKAKSTFDLLKQAAVDWMEDNALRLSAALSYYSIFSIAPLLVIAIAIAGWFLGPQVAQGMLHDQLSGLLGAKAAEGVEGMIQSASKPTSSVMAGIMGGITLLLGASGVFGQLKDALNTIWEVEAKPGRGVWKFIHERLLSFGMVAVIGFLLLVSLFVTTALAGVSKYLGSVLPMSGVLLGVLSSAVSFGVITVLFASVFKFLPDAKVQWRHVWIGAALTALLFEIGKALLAWYLGKQGAASAYGAATSAVLLLLWVYYASLILFYGAEFTQVYARAKGARIEPSENAQRVALVKEPKEPLKMTNQTSSTNQAAASSAGATEQAMPGPRKESARLAVGPELNRAEEPTNEFVEKNAVPLLLGAIGGGLLLGILLRRGEVGAELSPGDQVKHGSRALLFGAMAATAAAFNRWSKRAKKELEPARLRKQANRSSERHSTASRLRWRKLANSHDLHSIQHKRLRVRSRRGQRGTARRGDPVFESASSAVLNRSERGGIALRAGRGIRRSRPGAGFPWLRLPHHHSGIRHCRNAWRREYLDCRTGGRGAAPPWGCRRPGLRCSQ